MTPEQLRRKRDKAEPRIYRLLASRNEIHNTHLFDGGQLGFALASFPYMRWEVQWFDCAEKLPETKS